MCALGSSNQTEGTTSTMNSAGMGLTAISTLYGMSATGNAYDNQIATAKANAQLAAQQLADTGIAGGAAANEERQKGLQAISAQRAGYGAAGIDTNSGTALNVQSGTVQTAENNAQKVLYNTMLNQWGLKNEELQYNQQAKNLQTAKTNAETTALLSGLTKLASQYASFASQA